jgi:hypothetical protein
MHGISPIITVGLPGSHGASVIGRQGPCVTAPKLEAIIAATAGLAGLLHIPNGTIFTKGTLLSMLAKGMKVATTWLTGNTFNGEGVRPIVHLSWAPSDNKKLIVKIMVPQNYINLCSVRLCSFRYYEQFWPRMFDRWVYASSY